MRDYYAELGLNFGASSHDILAAVAAHPQNQEAANVLLNPLKKQVYDQTYFSMHEIGMLRAALGTQSPYWLQEQASFVRTEKQGRSIRTCKQLRRSNKLFWILLVFFIFTNIAVLYFYHDKFPELKNMPFFTFIEENNNLTTKESMIPEGPWKNNALNNIASYEKKYYKVFDSAQIKSVFSWEDAQKFCLLNYGQLAVIKNMQENKFITTWLEKFLPATDVYFGLTDKQREGIWVSGAGEKATFFNWAPGEPNNEFGREDYAMFYHRSPKGKWNDGVPGENFLFICKWDSEEDFKKFEQSIGGKANNIFTINNINSNKPNDKIIKKGNINSCIDNNNSTGNIQEGEIKKSKINNNSTQENTINKNEINNKDKNPNQQNQKQLVDEIIGTFDGAYQTDQESVAFTLKVVPDKNMYSAIFEFYPMDLHKKNTTNSGEFAMTVKYDKLTREYVFTGGVWVSRPIQGKRVHLRGRLVGNTLSGTVSLDLSNPGWTFSAVKNLSH